MTKPDFTGTWEFNSNKSTLQIPSPDSTTFVIEHREPHFHLERTHVFGTLNQGGLEIRARLYWEGETLVCDSRLEQGGEQATNIVRYSLADEGQTFIAEEQFRSREHSHENRWVFDKQ
jgi:hypothetical protein